MSWLVYGDLILGTECESDSCAEEDHQEVVSVWRIWCLYPCEWRDGKLVKGSLQDASTQEVKNRDC